MNAHTGRAATFYLLLFAALFLQATVAASAQTLPPPGAGNRVCVAVGERKQAFTFAGSSELYVTFEPKDLVHAFITGRRLIVSW
jgi:hypothetical protein